MAALVCLSKLPFPIPSGLARRPTIAVINRDLDLSLYPISYRVEKLETGLDPVVLEDRGSLACCSEFSAIHWPSEERQGALFPVEPGQYQFTGIVDTGYAGVIEYPPAVLTVEAGAGCTQEVCPSCPTTCIRCTSFDALSIFMCEIGGTPSGFLSLTKTYAQMASGVFVDLYAKIYSGGAEIVDDSAIALASSAPTIADVYPSSANCSIGYGYEYYAGYGTRKPGYFHLGNLLVYNPLQAFGWFHISANITVHAVSPCTGNSVGITFSINIPPPS